MQEQREVGGAELADQSLHPADVVEVAVAEDDRLQIAWRELEATHVLDQTVRGDAGVEQEAMLLSGAGGRDERREAVLCAQRVEGFPTFEDGGREARTGPEWWPSGGPV